MSIYRGSCHCGRVSFEAETDPFTQSVRCNCSLCRRRSAVMSTVQNPSSGFRLLSGADDLVLYQFHTGVARHFFCRHCGIYTHHQPRSNPDILRVNAGCLDGIDPYALEAAPVDGRAMD